MSGVERRCSTHECALETVWGEEVLPALAAFCHQCVQEQERATGGRCAVCDARYYYPWPPSAADPWPVVEGRHLCWRCAPKRAPYYICELHDQHLLGSGYLAPPMMGGWCPACHLEAEQRLGARCDGCGVRQAGPPPPGLASSWPAFSITTPDGVAQLRYCERCAAEQTGRAPHALAGAFDLAPEDLALEDLE